LIFGPAADRLGDSSSSATPIETDHSSVAGGPSQTEDDLHSREAKTTSSATDD